MSADTQDPHTVVVGGGVIGVSIATHLQRTGARVTIVTETEIGDGASGRSLSWLNSAGSRSAPYHALRMAGIDRYRTLSSHDPSTQPWLQFHGGLYWTTPENRAKVEQRHAAEQAHGYDSRLVDPPTAARLVPGLRLSGLGPTPVYNAGEGWVSLPHLITHLLRDFTAHGGQLHTHTGRASVRTHRGRATGITTTGGLDLDADTVVVACGASTPAVVEELDVHIDDRSPLSMLVTTAPVANRIRAVLNTPRVAVRPEPGGGYVLDHDWYEDEIIEHADGTCTVDESVVKELLNEASAILDADQLSSLTWKLGRKPIPADGEPVFGELHSVPGCYVAFTHSGATLALIAGELVTHELLTGASHPMLQTFRPERFMA